jgi:hypothetical protein
VISLWTGNDNLLLRDFRHFDYGFGQVKKIILKIR